MNSQLAKLEPAPVWRLFDAICAIPHPSGHETRLAAALAALAEKNGLAVRIDVTGNLRIDRPASPGFEDSPMILLQGHLDMVPQALATVDFDFTREPIPPVVEDGWVRSAAGTTLGSDDGIGVAAAMALLLDPGLKCGPLAGVFTVSEEVGLNGALALSAEFLKGEFLLNLDSEEEGQLYIGCAGGARLEIDVELPQMAVPPGYTGLCCEIKNLAGGHSGVDIHLRRGNAVAFLARLLEKLPEFEVAALSGGTLDNVIPREAVAFGAADPARLAALRLRAANLALEFAREFDAPPDFAVELRPAVLSERRALAGPRPRRGPHQLQPRGGENRRDTVEDPHQPAQPRRCGTPKTDRRNHRPLRSGRRQADGGQLLSRLGAGSGVGAAAHRGIALPGAFRRSAAGQGDSRGAGVRHSGGDQSGSPDDFVRPDPDPSAQPLGKAQHRLGRPFLRISEKAGAAIADSAETG